MFDVHMLFSWRDCVERDVEWAKVNSREWQRMAEDRNGWRRLVEGVEQTEWRGWSRLSGGGGAD